MISCVHVDIYSTCDIDIIHLIVIFQTFMHLPRKLVRNIMG